MNFDEILDLRGTQASRWSLMEKVHHVPQATGIPMGIADMDFRPPECATRAVQGMIDRGDFGYYGDDTAYQEAIQWWMATRHGWAIERDWILTNHGVVNGVAIGVNAFSAVGDGVILFTPVYDSFAAAISGAGRVVVECPLVNNAGRYEFDFAAYDAMMTGRERVVVLCSPHNPGGRVWTQQELRDVAAFCQRHDLILISDEIHQDLVYPDATHTVMAKAVPEIQDRLIVVNGTSKTFNVAAIRTGNAIIPDPVIRARFAASRAGMYIQPNAFGKTIPTAVYTPEGAAWLDALIVYLDANRRLFDNAINAIPGVSSMTLDGTYLAWVNFGGTGMAQEELVRRVKDVAHIAANSGTNYGKGGESFMRFNVATPRARVIEAVARLQAAFSDLQ